MKIHRAANGRAYVLVKRNGKDVARFVSDKHVKGGQYVGPELKIEALTPPKSSKPKRSRKASESESKPKRSRKASESKPKRSRKASESKPKRSSGPTDPLSRIRALERMNAALEKRLGELEAKPKRSRKGAGKKKGGGSSLPDWL